MLGKMGVGYKKLRGCNWVVCIIVMVVVVVVIVIVVVVIKYKKSLLDILGFFFDFSGNYMEFM